MIFSDDSDSGTNGGTACLSAFSLVCLGGARAFSPRPHQLRALTSAFTLHHSNPDDAAARRVLICTCRDSYTNSSLCVDHLFRSSFSGAVDHDCAHLAAYLRHLDTHDLPRFTTFSLNYPRSCLTKRTSSTTPTRRSSPLRRPPTAMQPPPRAPSLRQMPRAKRRAPTSASTRPVSEISS